MNIVFLTTEETHHYYLINEINRYYPVRKVFFQTKHIERAAWNNRLKRIVNPRRFATNVKALLIKILYRRDKVLQRQYEAKMFFNNMQPSLNKEIPSEEVLSFNLPEVVAKVKEEDADLIIVFGTEVLHGEILNIAKLAILNIHRNILPKYRGGGLPSWIFYNKDFGALGTTIHLCTKDLDAGDIVGQKYYKLQKEDRLYTLRYKTTVLSVELLKQVINEYEKGTVRFIKQEKSLLWTSNNMTIIKEIIARRNFNNYIKSLNTSAEKT